MDRSLALIVAPAGFGKTTLVGQWALQTAMPIAWLSLEPLDDNVVRFAAGVLAAVTQIHPEVGTALPNTESKNDGSDAQRLLAERLIIPLAESSPFVLVLDDLHHVQSEVVETLDWLLDNMPTGMRIMVTSRVEPALSLARRRSKDGVTEVHASDLSFTASEALAFFNDSMGIALDASQARQLQQRTEGWAAGLQLAGLSLKRGSDLKQVLARLSLENTISTYLFEEVLRTLTPHQRDFLMSTSILDQLSGSLCAAVVADSQAAVVLQRAYLDGLFLISLDQRNEWYRTHHLFGELLLRRLRKESPEREVILRKRAAQWWIQNRDPRRAAEQAMAAGDSGLLGEIIEGWGLRALLNSDQRSLARWLAALPTEEWNRFPMVPVLSGWLSVLPLRMPPRVADAETAVASARKAMAACKVDTGRRAELEGHLEGIEILASRPLELQASIEHMSAGLAQLPEGAHVSRSVLALQVGVQRVMQGTPGDAVESLRNAETWARMCNNVYAGIATMGYRSWAHRLQGDLGQATDACDAAAVFCAKAGAEDLGLAGHIHIERAHIFFERWHLPDALCELEEAIPRIRLLEAPFLLTGALVLLGRVRAASGDLELARTSMGEAVEVAAQSGHRLVREWARAGQWGLLLHDDSLFEKPMADTAYSCINHELTLYPVRAALERDPDDVLRTSEKFLGTCTTSNWVGCALDWALTCAIALHRLGRPRQASATLLEAATLGHRRGFVRPFADVARDLGPLVADLSRPARVEWKRLMKDSPLSSLIEKATACHAGSIPSQKTLSPREIEVLTLVREGKSNPDIARALFVSVGTIKTHMHRLLTKLKANNRVEAIRLAERSGLFE